MTQNLFFTAVKYHQMGDLAQAEPLYRQVLALTPNHADSLGVLFTIDHIIPQALGGQTVAENLCLACWDCNLIKNKRIADIDPETGQMTSLFHRYKHLWQEHFAWQDKGLLVIGLTPTGRATVNLLKLNRPALVHAREWWIKVGWHPPE